MAYVWEGTAALATTLAVALLLWRFLRTRLPVGARLPPGPQGWPFIGDIGTFMGQLTPQKAFSLLQTHGPVARVKAGFAEYIILNDLENIKRFLNHKDILCRCRSFVFSDSIDIGFARYEGKEWDENRRFSLKVLRNLGFGKGPMKEAFAEGSDSLVNWITEAKGNPIDLTELLMASLSDNMALFVFGQRYKFGNDDFSDLRTALRNEFIASRDPSALDSLPVFVTTLARMVPFTRAAHLLASMKSLQEFVRRRLSTCLEGYKDGQDRGFMGAYLTTYDEADYAIKSESTMVSMIGNAGSLVLAGGNAVTVVLTRLLLVLATHVDTVQRRIHQEIDNFTNGERRPTWEDRHSMPYTLATIWEVHRWCPFLALGSPRRAYNDLVIGEYFIPKGATIVANIWGVHNDPSYWSEPEKFDPSRFLNKDGSVAWEKVERVISFSVGKRMCPAEIFASVEIYTYMTRLMQKFLILPEEGAVFDPNIHPALLMQPKRHMFRCIPRACRAVGTDIDHERHFLARMHD